MQRVYASPDSPWHVPNFTSLIRPISRLLEAFGDRAVFTRFLIPEQPEGSWIEYYRDWSFIRQPEAAPLLDLAEPWTHTRLPMIDKTTFSKFGPELQRMAREPNTLVLCGVSTECCVLATAFEAADAGLNVRIVSDACGSVDSAAHESALLVARTGFFPMITASVVDEEVRRLRIQ